MKVISFLGSLQQTEKNVDKINTLKYFAQGVNQTGDTGEIIAEQIYQPCDVAVILGWVHEHGKNAPHLQFRKTILEQQQRHGGRTVIADSNLFLYKNTSNPGYWLRFSYDGVFPNTGEYCDSPATADQWSRVQQQLGIQLRPWRTQGNHILLCLQRDGGWSMKGFGVVQWAVGTITELRKHTNRPIRVRAHPGDKQAGAYSQQILALCKSANLKDIELSAPKTELTRDLKYCWAVVNHNSSPAVGAAIEGIPVFVTDPVHSQCHDIANTDLRQIETPILPDRNSWAQRISQFHWSHADLQSGACWTHMRKWAKK